MPRNRFFLYTLLLEGGLAVLAMALGLFFGLPLWNDLLQVGDGLRAGLPATLPLIACYFVLNCLPLKSFQEIDRIVRLFFHEYMRDFPVWKLAVVAGLAGLGEELFFRGLLQKSLFEWLGPDDIIGCAAVIFAVSILFALAHAVTRLYFFLAFLVSLYFGWLYFLTDNLFVPVLAHALYDFFVFIKLKMERSRR